jgi:ribosome-binding factor A
MSRRTERLSSMIRQELAMMILHELSDPRITGLPTITRVEVLEDLSNADVFITSMGTPGQQSATLNALKHSAGSMRAKLTKMLSIRTTPFLRFHHDDRLQREMEVLALLDLANREREEREARAAASSAEAKAGDAEQPAGQAVEQSTEHSVEQLTERSAEQSTGPSADPSSEPSPEN